VNWHLLLTQSCSSLRGLKTRTPTMKLSLPDRWNNHGFCCKPNELKSEIIKKFLVHFFSKLYRTLFTLHIRGVE
jgi:hypothetical protein